MTFYVAKRKENILSLARKAGYIPTPYSFAVENEPNFIRPLSKQGFPRFHIYIKINKEDYLFSLHLDQKKPSYGKYTIHSGEYEGEVIKKEAERIKKILC